MLVNVGNDGGMSVCCMNEMSNYNFELKLYNRTDNGLVLRRNAKWDNVTN